MPDILLATLNAKYPHAAFGLRYLLANMPAELSPRTAILEFDISQRTLDVAERILEARPTIVGLGVYIWNVEPTTRLVAELKRLRPSLTLVVGGPEVSYEIDDQPITQLADFIITGEADIAFGQLCRQILDGRPPAQKVIEAELPEFEAKGSGFGVEGSVQTTKAARLSVSIASNLQSEIRDPKFPILPNPDPKTLNPPLSLPYPLYTDHDLAHRVVYVEASRGCPFKCEFCLSSLDIPVRNVPLGPFLSAMQSLLDRGLRQFKFVDRTFNLNLKFSRSILEFFLDRYQPGLFLHFEMIPDRLPDGLRELIAKFPPGALQFEVGIQTFDEKVGELISRRQDNARVEENLRWLRSSTGVHVHADLIVGLPGEDLPTFARGFDRLVALSPQEIQVGILKRLRGTPIIRHDGEWQMVYSPSPPYEILQTKLIDFATMQRMRRFARYWDTVANSGNFRQTIPLLLGTEVAECPADALHTGPPVSAFSRFLAFSDELHNRLGRSHGIALGDLAEFLFTHLTRNLAIDPQAAAHALWADYQRAGRSDRPAFLRPYIAHLPIPRRGASDTPSTGVPRRQGRHLA